MRTALVLADSDSWTVDFCNVTFGYSKPAAILKDVSATFAPHTLTGITGPSGVGKTTLLNLTARLVEPWSGSIFVNNMDVAQMRIEDVRAKISFSPQDPFIFPGTIWENIAYGCRQPCTAEIVRAAQLAGADSFIRALPQKYETKIGPGGQSLSSGQRQRVGLARAFARPASLLILDEALNCLDLESRKQVISQLKRLRQLRTIVIVSHDPVILQECDCVMSLSDGTLRSSYQQFGGVHTNDSLCPSRDVEQVQ